MALSAPDTLITGMASGRVLSYSTSTGEVSKVEGEGHSNMVVALEPTPEGKIFSVGYDDRVREIEGTNFTSAPYHVFFCWTLTSYRLICRPLSVSLSFQPKSIAVTSDAAIVIVGPNRIEVMKSNQKVFELQTPFPVNAVAASKSVVAVGGLVSF
jgi:WD repeat-containing protein 1 (actin-interacting protein 1)